MTEQRIVELERIAGLRFECVTCHAATVVPVKRLTPQLVRDFAMAGCRFCGAETGFILNTEEMNSLVALGDALCRLATSAQNLKLRLELADAPRERPEA